MAPPLADLTAQAQTLTSAGDLAGARDMLADALDPADADPRRASPDLALAAALQARILIALGDPHGARTWAGFAHAAEERLHGPHDERTIAAAATHAAVLHQVGSHGRAAQLYHELVGELAAVDGPLSARVLAAEADLATTEHAAGQCTAARDRLAGAWARHQQAHGEDAPAGIKMLARLAAMERECGQDRDALQHFSQAQELGARYLAPDHPLGRQVARLAGAGASGRHVCGQVQRSTGPAPGGPAAGVTRVPATTPGVHPVRREPPAPGNLTETLPSAETPAPAPTSPSVETPVETPAPYEAAPPAEIVSPAETAQRPETYAPPGWDDLHEPGTGQGPYTPAEPHPPAEAYAPADPPRPVPRQGAWSDPSAEEIPDHHENQPQSPPPIAADPATGAWSGPPPLPAEVRDPWPGTAPHLALAEPSHLPTDPGFQPAQPGYPGHQPVEETTAWAGQPPGPWPPDSFPPAAYPPGTYPPGPRLPMDEPAAPETDRRLPVPVERPDPHSTRQSLVLAGVLVAGIAVAAAIVVATWPRDDAGPAAAPPAAASAPAAAPTTSAAARPTNAAIAPTSVQLQDNRDSVALTWRYPKGSEGPVLISGGRTGQEQRAFQQLPAGTTEYVVYGLNRQNNYCFSVAVVYTVDQVAASRSVCTRR